MVAAIALADWSPGPGYGGQAAGIMVEEAEYLLDAIDAHCAEREAEEPDEEELDAVREWLDSGYYDCSSGKPVWVDGPGEPEPPAPSAQETKPGVILPPTLDEMAERAKQAREDAIFLRKCANVYHPHKAELDAVATRIERGLHGYAGGGE